MNNLLRLVNQILDDAVAVAAGDRHHDDPALQRLADELTPSAALIYRGIYDADLVLGMEIGLDFLDALHVGNLVAFGLSVHSDPDLSPDAARRPDGGRWRLVRHRELLGGHGVLIAVVPEPLHVGDKAAAASSRIRHDAAMWAVNSPQVVADPRTGLIDFLWHGAADADAELADLLDHQ